MGLNAVGRISNSPLNASGEASIYANKGEPTYQKDMDLDEDGKITFDEFRQYCKDNNISGEDVKKLLQMRMLWKMFQEIKEKREEEAQEEKKDKIYSRKGEDNYAEEMDSNNDEVVTYDEYIKYCKNHAKEEIADKISQAYCPKEPKEEEIKIESEA